MEGDTGLAITDYSDAGQDERPDRSKLTDVLGPGLVTGASDDDPSGIATYAQAGAAFGFALSWTLLLTYPLMCAIQMISAEIGRVTGKGIAANMRRLLYLLWAVGLLVLANVINIGADRSDGRSAATHSARPEMALCAAFAILIVLLEVFMRYASYVSVLRWLTLSLFAYVATVFVVGVPWEQSPSILSFRMSVNGGLFHRVRPSWHDDRPICWQAQESGRRKPDRAILKRRLKRRGSLSASGSSVVGMGLSR